jgi:hypothetical protein
MTAPDTGRFRSKLAQLTSTATSVMNSHVNDQGLCAICGSAWPCERAIVAEHSLAAF